MGARMALASAIFCIVAVSELCGEWGQCRPKVGGGTGTGVGAPPPWVGSAPQTAQAAPPHVGACQPLFLSRLGCPGKQRTRKPQPSPAQPLSWLSRLLQLAAAGTAIGVALDDATGGRRCHPNWVDVFILAAGGVSAVCAGIVISLQALRSCVGASRTRWAVAVVSALGLAANAAMLVLLTGALVLVQLVVC